MIDKRKMVFATGKRKTAVAKAILKPGRGLITVNNVPVEALEPDLVKVKVSEPLSIAGDKASEVDIAVNVKGGGIISRAEAVRTAIARALVKWSKSLDLKKRLLAYDRTMLAGDPRRTEPKKFGGPGPRRRRQKSYR
ncbi:MAG: 30S ribosomal protein S9 [Candidatus Bathyarchaeia archaeon]|nr:30S ribosomal protein S9 [Candidatus Bathyarchaeota archaeon]